MNESFSIVVVTHDSAEDLERLVASLRLHLRCSPQLIVVDNGSRDASVEVARRAGAEVVELGRNGGFGAANNVATERARAPVTALLNPDIELLDEGLVQLVDGARAQRALFVPRLIGIDGEAQDSAHPVPGELEAMGFAVLGPALPPPLRLRAEPWRSKRRRPVGWAIAAALVARTDLFRSLGPFDPSGFLFYEDLDLCLRARVRGIPTMLDPSVVLRHRAGHSTSRAYPGEPYALLARRRREIVGARLGHRRLLVDDATQALTFASRTIAKRALGRDATRERLRLHALRQARRGSA